MSTGVETTGPRVLFYVPGGGFQLESQMLIRQLHGVELSLVLPDDSVPAPWMQPYRIHRVATLSTRANASRLRLVRRFVQNFWQSLRMIRRQRPGFVICVGSSICVPGFIAAKLLGIPRIYIESIARTDSQSATGALIERLHLASRYYVQWPDQTAGSRERRYEGTVL